MKYTIDDIIKLGPCEIYTRERIESLWDGRDDGLTIFEICDLDIPAEDRLWAVLRLIDVGVVRRLAVDFAEHVVGLSDDPRVQECIDVTRAYLDGRASVDDLYAADDAACDAWITGSECGAAEAARAAVWAADAATAADAARAADWAADAAVDAAVDAAWDAGDAGAAVDAAGDAGDAACADAEREWHLERVKEVLK